MKKHKVSIVSPKCDVCNKTFASKVSLKNHQKYVHSCHVLIVMQSLSRTGFLVEKNVSLLSVIR